MTPWSKLIGGTVTIGTDAQAQLKTSQSAWGVGARGRQGKGPSVRSRHVAPPRAAGPCGEAQACVSQARSSRGEPKRGWGNRTEEGLRLQELSDSQAETGTASLFTPGGGSDFAARVFWEKLSFPHLDWGRAQLLLPSLQSPYSHSCQAWGRCRRVLRGRRHLISSLSGVPRQWSHRDEV